MPPAPDVDRLWPDPASGLPLDEAVADALSGPVGPHPELGRAWVAVNMVTSIDGRAQLSGRADGLGGRVDRRLMQLYRAAFDAVATGSGTLRADDFYSRQVDEIAQRQRAAGRPPQPLAVLVAGAGRIPTDRRWFGGSGQRRIAVVGAASPHAGAEPLPEVETWVAPTDVPQPGWLLQRLGAAGVRSLLLEGGPTLNAAFLASGNVDELFWTIGPRVVANESLPMIAPVPPDLLPAPLEARLVSIHRHENELYLRYRFGSIGP